MVIVSGDLHALHVAGGIVAMGLVALGFAAGAIRPRCHWPVDFTALYWHFLYLVWLAMLSAFWLTTLVALIGSKSRQRRADFVSMRNFFPKFCVSAIVDLSESMCVLLSCMLILPPITAQPNE